MTRWAVGMIAAPRLAPTLERSLHSLWHAGFRDRVHIFWDGTKRGSWENWYYGALCLVQCDPDADVYLIVEDDAVYCRGLREWLERQLWPDEKTAILSPYLPGPFCQDEGWQLQNLGWYTVGSVCWVLNPEFLRSVIGHRDRISGYGSDARRHYSIDCRVGQFAERHGWNIWYHRPSLVQHIAPANSARHADAPTSPLRVAADFVGEEVCWNET